MGSVRLPQAQLSEIAPPPKRDPQTQAILAIGGNNPLAQGLNQAGPEIVDALVKRADARKKALQVNQLAKLAGAPDGSYDNLEPDTAQALALQSIKNKETSLDMKRKPLGNPFTGPDGKPYQYFYDEKSDKTTAEPLPFGMPGAKPTKTIETTTIYQDPNTGQVSPSAQKGWIQRILPTDKATTLLATSFNQGANRDKPTSQTKSTAEFARTIIPHIDTLRNLVEEADQKGYIGPAAGRVYGEFLAGKVGSTGDREADQLLGRLRATDSLMKTGTMKVHFGSRGGSQMYDHFSDMLNTGKQSKAVLNGALDGIEEFMQGYSDAAPDKSGLKTIKSNESPQSRKARLLQELLQAKP